MLLFRIKIDFSCLSPRLRRPVPYNFLALLPVSEHGVPELPEYGCLQLVVDHQRLLRRVDVQAASLYLHMELLLFTMYAMPIVIRNLTLRYNICKNMFLGLYRHVYLFLNSPPQRLSLASFAYLYTLSVQEGLAHLK